MSGARHIILVDSEVRRRATISHHLSSRGIHVEPFETLAEFSGHSLRQELILIHDVDKGLFFRLASASAH